MSLNDNAKIALSCLDLTSLGDEDTSADIKVLLNKIPTPFGPVAAVCVWPKFIPQVQKKLQGTSMGIAGVANFPQGETDIPKTIDDIKQILDNGGTEIDVVYPWQAHLDGDLSIGPEFVRSCRKACGDNIILKVILESGELEKSNRQDIIKQAALFSIQEGANFLKTSTGKTSVSATINAAHTMLEAIAERDKTVGFKASGGIRTVVEASAYIELAQNIMGPAWITPKTFRFGASSLLADIITILSNKTSLAPAQEQTGY